MSELFPPGITDVRDMPYRWFDAILRAMQFLSFEELLDEERPPRKIWLNGDKLTAWFDQVKRNREAQAKGDAIEDPQENAAAAGLIVG